MKKTTLTSTFILTVLLLVACSVVPLTGRKQLNMVSDSQVLNASFQQYKAFIAKAPISKNQLQTQRVIKIGRNIAHAAENYLKSIGMGQDVKNYQWEFNLVASNQANAFCMPGGKIVVYEGILKYAHTDAELATVMAHEVSHALAKHANERMSQAMLKQYGGAILGTALGGQSTAVRQAASVVYGLGSEMLVILPYSRKHEYEADQIGLTLMALAGYNPNEAVKFWQNMAAGNKSSNAEFLSTHPTDRNRIKAIQKALPEAMKYYRAGGIPQQKTSKKSSSVSNLRTHY